MGMPEKEGASDELVGRLPAAIRRLWDDLPPGEKNRLLDAVSQIPGEGKGWRNLLKRASEHVRFATGRQQRVAIIGPANAGKSTLYNQLIQSRSDRAQVSAVPGTTRVSSEAEAGLFVLVDTPGADAVGQVGEGERALALTAAAEADVILALFDASHGIRAPEKRLFDDLIALDRPLVVALNKIDLIGRERPQVIGRTAAELGLRSDQIIPLSAKEGEGIGRVLQAVARTEPGIAAAIGAAIPLYRWDLAQGAIARAASTAAAVAITPLPFLDFFPLIGLQVALVIGLARIYDQRMTAARARELIATFGLGLLGRSLFYELSKLGGPPGWLVAAAVAAGTTAAIGYAVANWFESGSIITSKQLRRISRAVGDAMIERLANLGKRKPEKAKLKDRVSEILNEMEVQVDDSPPQEE
jgi:small GTP-binding protein